jgi:DNA-binding response OmpR family regulator
VEQLRVLVVEDHDRMADMLRRGLEEDGYAVDTATTGEDGLWMASESPYDAIVLDVMLPGVDGIDVCRALRRGGSNVPVLMLTARDAVESRISGLDAGADDYLTKPFDFGELLARLRAVIRRGRLPLIPAVITVGHLRLDLRARQASRTGRPVNLTAREFALLEFLALHAGEVVGRGAIAEHVWDSSFDSMSNVIDVMIQRLRRKLDAAGEPSLITTRRGEGYMLGAIARTVAD